MPAHHVVAPPPRSRRSPDPFSRAKADGNGHGHHDGHGHSNGRDESRPSSGGSSVLGSDKSQKTNRMGLGHLVD
jgi:hypothetical protein